MRRGDLERGIALDTAKHDIASRLRRVCAHFAEEEFAELVDRMAEIDVRYRMREEWVHYIEPNRARPHSMN
ncbi:MAG: hypothetical protein WD825_04150 [Gemmatimonadaceae bacterium]